ncbi:hypothetical protein SESBI_29814 [Sesbania bispinosa]|nr:hypothetical protein SESBI_29814 [Sesbania bispinosa]
MQTDNAVFRQRYGGCAMQADNATDRTIMLFSDKLVQWLCDVGSDSATQRDSDSPILDNAQVEEAALRRGWCGHMLMTIADG